jgi:hypothetical protein
MPHDRSGITIGPAARGYNTVSTHAFGREFSTSTAMGTGRCTGLHCHTNSRNHRHSYGIRMALVRRRRSRLIERSFSLLSTPFLRSVAQPEAAPARENTIQAIQVEFPAPLLAMRAEEPDSPPLEGRRRKCQRHLMGNLLATWPNDPQWGRVLERRKQVVGIKGDKVVCDSSHEPQYSKRIATVW